MDVFDSSVGGVGVAALGDGGVDSVAGSGGGVVDGGGSGLTGCNIA